MKDNSRPIGIFDSGIGGISVLKEIVALMPEENYIMVIPRMLHMAHARSLTFSI